MGAGIGRGGGVGGGGRCMLLSLLQCPSLHLIHCWFQSLARIEACTKLIWKARRDSSTQSVFVKDRQLISPHHRIHHSLVVAPLLHWQSAVSLHADEGQIGRGTHQSPQATCRDVQGKGEGRGDVGSESGSGRQGSREGRGEKWRGQVEREGEL